MILGTVNSRLEATLQLEVVGPIGQKQGVTAVIDTGYSEDLTLPIAIANALSLTPLASRRVRLEDASVKILDVYRADILWDGQLIPVRVLCVEGDPLVGTGLLRDYQLTADFVVGGQVVLQAVP